METELIDGVYAGPATKLARDWSVAPFAGLSSVRLRRLIPPFAQIMSELGERCRLDASMHGMAIFLSWSDIF